MKPKRSYSQKPNWGTQSLLNEIPETFKQTSHSVYHGGRCKRCIHIKECRIQKGGIDESEYCHWGVNRFVSNERIIYAAA